MAKSKYPTTVFVTLENDDASDEAYFLVNKTAREALEATDGNTVAEYKLVSVRNGRLVPEFD